MNKTVLILGMMLVTYIPRYLPFLVLADRKLPPALSRFLKLIPYTALGALIIPGVFTAVSEYPLAGCMGALSAVFVAWKKNNLVLSVLSAIAVTYLILLIK